MASIVNFCRMQKMGTMTEIPFIGGQFNRIYPIFMVIYTGLLASNVLNRVMDYFGSWRYFRSHDAEDGEGFDPSGLIILRKGTLQFSKCLFAGFSSIDDSKQ